LTTDADRALLSEVRRIGKEVASPNADEVDRDARFPSETVAALRDAKALSALVPSDFGGTEVSLGTVAMAAFELARHCGASAMVFAMHQIQVAVIARHGRGTAWFDSYLTDVVADQRLIASATSEVGTGGDLGRSIAAVEPDAAGDASVHHFRKQAPTVSYGEYADDLLTTLRRGPDAEPGDQVMVLSTRGQAELTPQGTWDPLGMRGTCSPGFIVEARFPAEQILDVPFSRVASESMVPVSHLLWSHVWLGLATDAFDRAKAFVRASARQRPGEVPASARRLSALMTELALLRGEVTSALRTYLESPAEELNTFASAIRFNNLKVAASEQAPKVCLGALNVCGIVGYKNDTEFSVGRHLRDALSAPLMVTNERIHETNAHFLLIAKDV
jgi:acyl-CoA dehydrogenase